MSTNPWMQSPKRNTEEFRQFCSTARNVLCCFQWTISPPDDIHLEHIAILLLHLLHLELQLLGLSGLLHNEELLDVCDWSPPRWQGHVCVEDSWIICWHSDCWFSVELSITTWAIQNHFQSHFDDYRSLIELHCDNFNLSGYLMISVIVAIIIKDG